MKLRDKIAIVTGGSRGIGKTVAEFFLREGARVVVVSRDKKEIAGAVQEIAEVTGVVAGKKISGVTCDVSDAKAVARVVRAVGSRHRRIDILVNAAGIQAPIGPFKENKLEAWEKNIAVNLFGTVAMCKAILPFMVKRGGSIINFAGGGATSSRPNFSAYAVAKTGVVKFTEILADELSPSHVRVNAISPGAVNTAMLAEVLAAGSRAGKKEFEESKKRFRDGGVSPELAAALAVFLASNDSRGLTGRLISAPWDTWRTWDKRAIKKIMATDKFTLRRKIS
jgi:NAD(P)-dependent dehydrogenase (short-subunit alcohol dehydrogenase family)